MSFLTSKPDFSGTIYENQDAEEHNMQRAKEYLLSEIGKTCPEWLNIKQGILGEYWERDDTYAACYLIWFAMMINALNNNITERSTIRLQKKFKEILCSFLSEDQFIEKLTELEVAWGLVGRVSPLSLEPMTSEEAFLSGNPPVGPDFAFRLPEKEDVYAEATVWSAEILNKWEKAVGRMLTVIQDRLFKQGRALKIQIQLPLQELKQEQIVSMTRYAWSKISTRDSGQLPLMGKGTIRWSPYPVTSNEEDIPTFTPTNPGLREVLLRAQFLNDNAFLHISSSGIVHSSGILVDRAFMKEPDIALLSEEDIQAANKIMVKSFGNRLKKKRNQFPHEAPYLLFIKPGHFRILTPGLIEMIERKIWKEKDYDWVTGIVLFTSRNGFMHSDPGPNFLWSLNPNASYPASDALKSVLEGKAQFHWP